MFTKLYWILPLISALMWLATLLALLISWVVDGEPIYASEEKTPRVQTIAYISDVGAQHLKPLFIAGAVITTVFLDAGMLAERWLRHKGKLAPNTSWLQKGLDILALICALAGTAGLILLSIFDTLRHPKLHDDFLALFIIGYLLSAIFICAEYQRLGIKFRVHRVIRASFWLKLFFIIVEIALAIPFGVLNTNDNHPNVAAVLEWVIAFVFTCYILTFLLDLLPAVKSERHRAKETVAEFGGQIDKEEMQTGGNGMNGGNGYGYGSNTDGMGGDGTNGMNGYGMNGGDGYGYGSNTNGMRGDGTNGMNGYGSNGYGHGVNTNGMGGERYYDAQSAPAPMRQNF